MVSALLIWRLFNVTPGLASSGSAGFVFGPSYHTLLYELVQPYVVATVVPVCVADLYAGYYVVIGGP